MEAVAGTCSWNSQPELRTLVAAVTKRGVHAVKKERRTLLSLGRATL